MRLTRIGWRMTALAVLALTVPACGGSAGSSGNPGGDDPKPAAKDVKLAPLDLSAASAEFPFVMDAPEGAKAKDGFTGVEVSDGGTFQIEFGAARDLGKAKREAQGNKLNKLKRIVTDTADTLVYESELAGNAEFHFVVNLKVGDKTVSAEDTKGPRYSQADVELMVKCLKSLKPKAKK